MISYPLFMNYTQLFPGVKPNKSYLPIVMVENEERFFVHHYKFYSAFFFE